MARMYLVGDAARETILFLPNSSLNRLRQVNLVFLQAIRRRIAQLSPSTLQTNPIKELKKMAYEENWLGAIKSEMTKIKEEMRADAEKDRRQKFQQFGTMHHALAVITIAVEKYEAAKTVSNYCTEPDTPFKFDPSATGEVEAALREIGRDIYKDGDIGGTWGEADLNAAIDDCVDEGMLHRRIDGRLQFAPHAQWKIVKERKKGGDLLR